MAGYIGANTSSVNNNQNAAERRKKFTFTAATTSLTGLNFLPNKIHIFHNGIRLVKDTDFTEASDGKSVTLTNAAQAGDEVVAVTFAQAPTTDVVPASTGGTFSGDVVASTRLQVGDSSITNAYGSNASLGYVADFQGSTGNQTFISIAVPSASSLGDNGVVIGEDATDTYIIQRGNKNIKLATQNLNRIVVDGSGRVTSPYQPSFSVRSNGGNNGNTWDAGQVIKFQTVQHNVGSHYSTSTGRFTAPVAGYYVFHYIGFGYTGGTVPAAQTTVASFRINGSPFSNIYNYLASTTSYPSITGSAGFYLSASDYVDVLASSQGQYADASNLYTAFSGYLLH